MADILLPQAGDEVSATWGQNVARAINGIQAGQAQSTATGAATLDLVVTFPKPYTVAPIVTVTSLGGNTFLADIPAFPTPTGFTVRWFRRDGAVIANGTVMYAHWIATGTLV